MRALISREPGPPSSLAVEELPDPVPTAGEVVVRMEAAALNFFDTLMIADRYQFKPERPFSPAAEGAGVVDAVGEGVGNLAPGEKVVLFRGHGCAREKVVAKAHEVFPRPDGVAPEIAAGVIVTYGTTLHALRDRAALAPGESLAVLGAAGGTGQAAVEIGKLMGARVIACASSADKLDFARALGADETINYAEEPLRDRLKALTGGAGVDVVYDPVGGELAEQALRGIAWLGRFLVIGFAAGEIPRIPLNLVLLKGCDVRGVFWGGFIERNREGHRRNVAELLGWVAQGRLKPHVDGVFPLEKAQQALELIAERKAKGKLVLAL